jgi:uncharacterized protein (TIGR02246 family)
MATLIQHPGEFMYRFSKSAFVFAVSSYLALGCLLLPALAVASKVDTHHDDEEALRAQADEYAKAFAAGDASTIANMWTVDGTYTDSNGQEHKGRAEIEKLFQSYFKQYGAQPLKITIESIRFPASGVAVEEGSTSLTQGSSTIVAKYTVVHQKTDGGWHMIAVSETNCQPQVTAGLKDLGWLAGSWSASGRGYALHFKGRWDAGHHFLGFGMDNSGIAFECLGWNPVSNRIVSWHFDLEGGFGNGTFSRDGDTWTEHAVGLQPDGTMSHANYVIKKISDDKFTWRSIDRTINGVSLPDTQEIVITRDSAN